MMMVMMMMIPMMKRKQCSDRGFLRGMKDGYCPLFTRHLNLHSLNSFHFSSLWVVHCKFTTSIHWIAFTSVHFSANVLAQSQSSVSFLSMVQCYACSSDSLSALHSLDWFHFNALWVHWSTMLLPSPLTQLISVQMCWYKVTPPWVFLVWFSAIQFKNSLHPFTRLISAQCVIHHTYCWCSEFVCGGHLIHFSSPYCAVSYSCIVKLKYISS